MNPGERYDPNVENIKIKKNPGMSRCVQTFNWYCVPQNNLRRHTCCIPGDYLMKLVEIMLRVCKAVIKAKGGYFEESQI